MKYKFEITKRLIGLNEYTNTNRYNKYAGAKQKKEEQEYIKYCILQQLGKIKIEKFEYSDKSKVIVELIEKE